MRRRSQGSNTADAGRKEHVFAILIPRAGWRLPSGCTVLSTATNRRSEREVRRRSTGACGAPVDRGLPAAAVGERAEGRLRPLRAAVRPPSARRPGSVDRRRARAAALVRRPRPVGRVGTTRPVDELPPRSRRRRRPSRAAARRLPASAASAASIAASSSSGGSSPPSGTTSSLTSAVTPSNTSIGTV